VSASRLEPVAGARAAVGVDSPDRPLALPIVLASGFDTGARYWQDRIREQHLRCYRSVGISGVSVIAEAPSRLASTDGFVRVHWQSPSDITDRMSEGWREYLGASRGHPFSFLCAPMYRDPLEGSCRPQANGGDPESIRAAAIESGRVDRIVVVPRDFVLASSVMNAHLARATAAAINDWLVAEWDDLEAGVGVAIGLQMHTPEDAAEELERFALTPGVVAAVLGGNVLARPFGHPVYRPVVAAAAAHRIPLVLETGLDPSWTDTATAPTAGGYAMTTAEYLAFRADPAMTHVASLIVQGVFEAHPDLRVLLTGTGITWVPAFLWRLDACFKPLRAEAPWLKRLPSEYFMDHIRIATDALEQSASRDAFERAVTSHPGLEQVLVYGSGFPDANAQAPSELQRRLPHEWHDHILSENADSLFRWQLKAG
jgi:predicted TIM-barrel fold metal-dependent hydrolase